MELEPTSGSQWGGFSCPACQTRFRVAAESADSDVVCPSCNQTLRLPKVPLTVPTETHERDAPKARKSPVFKNLRSVSAVIFLLLTALVISVFTLNSKKPELAPTEATIQVPAKIQTPEAPVPPPPPPVAVRRVPQSNTVAPPVLPVPKAETVAPPVTSTPPPLPALVGENDLVDAIPVDSPPSPRERVSLEPSQAVSSEPLPPTKTKFHTVVRGDTLSGIARTYRVEQDLIKQANQMKSDVVQLGAELVIPQP